MKAFANEWLIPYPMSVLKGHLLLSGVEPIDAEGIIKELALSHRVTKKWPTVDELQSECKQALASFDSEYLEGFQIVNRYYDLRRSSDEIDPIILVLEGSSATGKSMLILDLIQILAATRFVSTDTMRQVLRTQMEEEEVPELFCHTYQAHQFKQAGSKDLHRVVRGFIAQEQIIRPQLRRTVRRISEEGTEGVIEGVHIIPGTLSDVSNSILEVLIEPEEDTHHSMFMSKKSVAGLNTVVGATDEREEEFANTRLIQNHMRKRAEAQGVPIIRLETYKQATKEIASLVLEKMKSLIQ